MGKIAAHEVTDFWLNEIGPEGWFNGGEAVDQAVRDRFLSAWEQAADLVHGWTDTAQGALAALLLTDQFPRNMFREDPRAFATDPLARELADAAIARGFDMQVPEEQRNFFYLPFEHSEDLADQDRAIALIGERGSELHLRHARLHRAAIAHFGRFPWRNNALGREPTEEEAALMEAGGYGAMVSGKVVLAAE